MATGLAIIMSALSPVAVRGHLEYSASSLAARSTPCATVSVSFRDAAATRGGLGRAPDDALGKSPPVSDAVRPHRGEAWGRRPPTATATTTTTLDGIDGSASE